MSARSVQLAQVLGELVAAVSGTFGGRTCIRLLDQALVLPEGTALYMRSVAQPAPRRVTDVQTQFPALARAMALWHLAPQEDKVACWNAFVDIEVELEKVLNAPTPQPVQPKEKQP